ncbi:MAG: hypothetical protein EA352_06500 [Gemmatimonadales bacterium]|nr:MAG: hypothetical protein EA352_06500 [Gemmatimonadales bacterium]
MKLRIGTALLPVLLLTLLPIAGLQAQDLPDADELISRHVELIGGAEAHTTEPSRTTGNISLPAMGLEGSFVLLQSPPDRMAMTMDLAGMGQTRTGFDGEVGWSMNELTGPSLMEGDELVQTREQTLAAAQVRDRSVVPERETIEAAEYGGEACWKVRLVWESGRETMDCYSVESGLLVASEAGQVTAMGEVNALTLYGDYQDFDGRLLPTRLVQSTMGIEQVMTIESVEWGEVDPEALALPAAIRALLGEG